MNGNYSIVASRVGSAYGLKVWVGRDLCAYIPYGSVTARQVCEGLQEGFTRSVFNKCVYYKGGSEVLTGLLDSYLNR